MTSAADRIAYFVSSHGFGHAARACAVMEAVRKHRPEIFFDIFTITPRWFFEDSLKENFSHYPVRTDVGLVQTSPFQADLPMTIQELDRMYPVRPEAIADIVDHLRTNPVSLIVCDISPMGIEIGKQVDVPSLLIENFTWDWIYEPYAESFPEIRPHIRYLASVFSGATYHIQTEPVCRRNSSLPAAPPAGRSIRNSRETVRRRLGLRPEDTMVLITTGGIPEDIRHIEKLQSRKDFRFVIPGGKEPFLANGNLIFLPHRSEFYHPDLVHAADAVIGKAGYSTVAEVYQAQVPFGYVIRPDFRESAKLAAFIRREMTGVPIPQDEFTDGRWMNRIRDVADRKTTAPPVTNGADMIGSLVMKAIETER